MIQTLKTYLAGKDHVERAQIAVACQTSPGHLANVANGNANCSPALARHLQRETGGAVQPWDCRPDDWSVIWHEMIGAEGAPAVVPAKAA